MTSDRTVHRLSRILSLLPWVIKHEGADIGELTERFGYEMKSDLVKDLHLVFLTGLPGYGPGDLIDVDIFEDEVFVGAADYFSNPLRLTAPEALGLLAAGLTFSQLESASPSLLSAVRKLTTAVIPDAESFVSFDVPTPGDVERLNEAIEDCRVLRISYVSIGANERSVRDVEGRFVVFSLGNWYLTGHCRKAGAERVFRVDRIESIEVLDEIHERSESARDSTVGYCPSDSDTHVGFTVNKATSWVSEYYPCDAEVFPDGSQRITISVSDPLIAARLLLRLSDGVSDIKGDEVVEVLEDLRTRVIARYGYID